MATSLRLESLYGNRAAAEAKLATIIAGDTGFDSSLDGEAIVAATERYRHLIEFYDDQIVKEMARAPWQGRVLVGSPGPYPNGYGWPYGMGVGP